MGLAKRIVPVLLHRGSSLVKGKQFAGDRVVGHALQAARTMARRGVDELVLLNIGATPAHQGPDFNMVRELCADTFTPIAVGGGIGNLADADGLFEAGADKIVLGSRYMLTKKLVRRYGSQAVVVSLDVITDISTPWKSYAVGTIERAVDFADLVANKMGCGEILLTSIDREGMMGGYDLQLIKAVSQAVNVPVIAHGGCGSPQHMLEAIQVGADAVAAGSLFQFTDTTPADCAKYLHEHGVEVRLPKDAKLPA